MMDFDNEENLGVLKENFANVEYPFTELLSLLKVYNPSPTGTYKLIYSQTALQAIDQHAANAIQSLLLGMQSIGYALGMLNEATHHTHHLGFVIQSISNLVEALHQLRIDISPNSSSNLSQIPK